MQGTTHAAPLSRDKIEALSVQRATLTPCAYEGPISSPEHTVTEFDPACRFVAAIPPVASEAEAKPQLPGRKPDDPTLEAAFRFVLRNDRTPAEIDQRMAEVRKYVAEKPELQAELREALKLGVYLIEEAQAGRLKIPYGSPHCLTRMREMLKTLQEPQGLIGYWPIRGDCQDHSGAGRHGINHGVDLETAQFNGRSSFIEVPAAGLNLGTSDFTISAWVCTNEVFEDVIGDVVSQYDAARRRGLNLYMPRLPAGTTRKATTAMCTLASTMRSSVPGKIAAGPAHEQLCQQLNDGLRRSSLRRDHRRGKERRPAHVFRYKGGTSWEDCGHVTDLEAHGAGPMIVHDHNLYVATWNYDWTRVAAPPGVKTVYDVDFCRVYRYADDRQWIDCGQPGQSKRLFGIASYKGSLYVVGDDMTCQRYVGEWTTSRARSAKSDCTRTRSMQTKSRVWQRKRQAVSK